MTLVTAWTLMRRFWWAIPMLALLAALLVTRTTLASRTSQLQAVRTEYALFKRDVTSAATQALAAQKAINAAKQKEYADAAVSADANFDALRIRFAEQLRRQAAGGDSRAPASPAPGDRSGVPQAAPTSAGILVSPDDAARIADLAAYATAAHQWALSLE